MASQLTRTRATIWLCAVVAAVTICWLVWRSAPHARTVTGVVNVVNAFQSKVCLTPDGASEQWCDPFAVSGETIAAGQHVIMIITPLNTANGQIELGTVVPSRLGVTR